MTKRALLAAAVLGVAWGPCPAAQTCGARWYRGADPIGGGPGYTRMADPASARRVATLEELQAALSAARPGDTVYIDDRAEIDATGSPMMEIPAGVTLASGRGRNGSPGTGWSSATTPSAATAPVSTR